jgi:hypothetical protein
MATKDGFPPDDLFPLFLSEHAENTEQPMIGKARDRRVISSRILKTGILVVTAAVIGIAILSVENPVALLSNVVASRVDRSALQPGTDQPTPTVQSIAGTQDLPPTARDASTRDETAAALEPADQGQTEIVQPPTGALLQQFQAWAAAKEEIPAERGPVQPAQDTPVQAAQDARAQVVQNAPAQVRPMKKHRQVRPMHSARAEIRPQRNPRAKVRGEQNARVQIPPAPDARAQDQSAQDTQAPGLLQSLGWRN